MKARAPGRRRQDKLRNIEGLNHEERLAKLEGTVFGTRHRPGLDLEHDALSDRLEAVEDRKASSTWWGRLIARITKQNGPSSPAE